MILPKDLNREVPAFIESYTDVTKVMDDVAKWLRRRGLANPGYEVTVYFRIGSTTDFANIDRFGPLVGNWEPHLTMVFKEDEDGYAEVKVSIFWGDWENPNSEVEWKDTWSTNFDIIKTVPREIANVPNLHIELSHWCQFQFAMMESFETFPADVGYVRKPNADWMINAKELSEWLAKPSS